MKILETINNNIANGIFNALYTNYGNKLAWLSLEVANALDYEYYYGLSSNKEISPLFRNLREMYYDTHITILSNIIYNKYSNKWNRLINALVDANYNPIENYNMQEVRNKDVNTSNEGKQSQQLTSSNNSSSGVYGFNSNVAVNSDEVSNTQTIKSNLDDNITTFESSNNENENLSRSGNIGVTSTQRLLMQEIELRKNNVINIILNDVDILLCMMYYSQ